MPDYKDEKLLHCAFCGKSRHDVSKLIAGPSGFICNKCVALRNELFEKEYSTESSVDVELELQIRAYLNYLCGSLDSARFHTNRILLDKLAPVI